MRRSVYFLSILACSGIWFTSCSDDSDSGKNSGDNGTCQCTDGQVCNDNGECIDDPGKTGPDEPLGPDACDNKCNPDQTCKDGKCVDAESPIPDQCKPGCGPDQTCTDSGCIDKSKICDPACSGDRECVDNQCTFTCDVHCGDSCCEEGQACDTITNTCGGLCSEGVPECNGFCCDETQECLDNVGCAVVCQESEHRCVNEQSQMTFCCQSNELCDLDEMRCVLDCGSNERCNEVCCGDGEICLDEKACKPACLETQTRCGENEDLCCNNDNEICIFNKCLTKGTACKDSNECNLDEFCDPASNSCVKASESPNVCEYHPEVGKFSPKVKWHWEGHVYGTPVVVNLTDDNGDGKINQNDIPEVVFVDLDKNALYALSGDTGEVIAVNDSMPFNPHDDLGAADIDNDGLVEVLVDSYTKTPETSGLYAFNIIKNDENKYEWKVKRSILGGAKITDIAGFIWSNIYMVDMHPQFVDIDSNGSVEVVTTRGVLAGDNWDSYKCQFTLPATYGAHAYLPVVADLDRDGNSEIISYKTFDKDCNLLMDEALSADGKPENWYYAAVADLIPDDKDPEHPGELVPEIARVRSGYVSVWKVYKNTVKDGDKEKVVWSERQVWKSQIVDNKGNPGVGGGNLVIADFDGNHEPDIGVASRDYYIVFNGKTGEVIWTTKTQDHTSDKTGSTVFDFDGDGTSEVVYRDETRLRIYSGPGGELAEGDKYKSAKILWETPNYSGTIIEYPIVVDVDNDGKTEIVMVSNRHVEDGKNIGGVTVYSDTWNNWVRTRRIWNQHAYHVTNINEDGTVPQHEQANWLTYNNYRQNIQPEGAFNAPNFTPGNLDSEAVECDLIKLTAHVKNEGSYGIKAGLPVNFYVVNPNGKTGNFLIGTAYTTAALPPAGETTAILEWNRTVTVQEETIKVEMPADIFFHIDEKTDDTPTGMYAECNEEDNRSEPVQALGCGIN